MSKFSTLLLLLLVVAGSAGAVAQQPLQADLNPALYTPGVTYYDAGSGQNFYYDSATGQFMITGQATAPAVTTPTNAAVQLVANAAGYGAEAQMLAILNDWRARSGRGPVGWDSGLAYYASLNTGVHAPGTNGGGAQCWASPQDLVSAMYMWMASPPHAAILLNATTAVGASICPSGSTLNAR